MSIRYSPAERDAALRLYREWGPAEAARRTGIPKGTIASWARREGVQTDAPQERTRAATEAAGAVAAGRRLAIRDRLLDVSERLIDRMMAEGASASDLRQLSIALGVVIDKYRLEVGEATGRSEVDLRARLQRAAAEMGLDFDDVAAEAERLLSREPTS